MTGACKPTNNPTWHVVMVRDENDDLAVYGPFRSDERAGDYAELIKMELERLSDELIAWAYVVPVAKPVKPSAAAVTAWDPDATK